MSQIAYYSIEKWLTDNSKHFTPPVCNKCMFSDQLVVFFVGGPNQRKDFHVEEGEEFFYQIKGEMCLRVLEKGQLRDVIIKQDEVFMLPAKIQHSPQRYGGTVGLVVERRRDGSEMDGLRYFMENSTEPLFERWLQLRDIVKDLPPVIKEYFASDAHATGQPTADSVVVANRPFEPDNTRALAAPLNIKQWIDNNRHDICKASDGYTLYGAPLYDTAVTIYPSGRNKLAANDGETLLLQLIGTCSVRIDAGGDTIQLQSDAIARISANTEIELIVDEESFVLLLQMPSPRNILTH